MVGIYAMSNLPTGTVTFLFTDIEGSIRLWERHQRGMQSALALHDNFRLQVWFQRRVDE